MNIQTLKGEREGFCLEINAGIIEFLRLLELLELILKILGLFMEPVNRFLETENIFCLGTLQPR